MDASHGFVEYLINGIQINRERIDDYVQNSLMLVTALSPKIGYDRAARVAVKSLLRRLAAEGRTLFFTSHVLADVEELCSSIAVLERGEVRWRGAPAALCERYGERGLEQAFMRCIGEPAAQV